ncbi:hypothetical protein PIB30_103894, partial [Stylosanthes scabra]|nr:hypothetical protein [Stylosanthes scabra]
IEKEDTLSELVIASPSTSSIHPSIFFQSSAELRRFGLVCEISLAQLKSVCSYGKLCTKDSQFDNASSLEYPHSPGESVLHCLVDCPFAADGWRQSGLCVDSGSIVYHDFWKWWLNLIEHFLRRPNQRRKGALAATILWKLWNDKNLRIFENKASFSDLILQLAKTEMDEFHRYHPP